MKAWLSGEDASIEGLVFVETPVPEPGPGELLVRVDAAALNFSDLLMIGGRYQVRPHRPFTPGQEIAGTLVESGSRIAAKVFWGGFAEYAIVRADMAIPVPDAIPAHVATSLPVVYTTALVALTETVTVDAQDWLLVTAATGGFGIAAMQVARHLGARVIAVTSGPEKAAIALEEGAEIVVDSADADLAGTIMEKTGGKGVRFALDSVGGAKTEAVLSCLAWRGEILLVGFLSGEIPRIPANRLLLKGAAAKGVYWDHDRDAEMVARCSTKAVDLCAEGVLRPRVTTSYGLPDLPRALEDLQSRRSVGKLVLRLG